MLAELRKPVFPATRRTQRIMERIDLIVSGKLSDRTDFEEETCTSAISADGATFALRTSVHKGQVLCVVQEHTGEQALCIVAHVGPASNGSFAVRVRLLENDSPFWNIACPPDNWTLSLGHEEQELALAVGR